MNKKIGIFGGTFDPPHIEHVNIIKSVIHEFDLDKMIVIPSGNPPHKSFGVTDKIHRYNMARLAFSHIINVEISDIEINKLEKNYSFQTIDEIKKLYPGDEVFFIIGEDSLRDIETWKEPKKILNETQIIVVPRDGVTFDDRELKTKYDCKIYSSSYVGKKISSTRIKVALEFFETVNKVPETVRKYIIENELYSNFSKYVNAVRRNVSESRFKHTKDTVIACLELNYVNKLNLAYSDIFIAATLHDIAKNISRESAIEMGFVDDNIINSPQTVVHSHVGAHYAKQMFPELSDDIINSIKYHTTFRANMSTLEKVVAIGDSIEETRVYKDVERIRKLSFENIDKGIKAYLINNVAFLKSRNFVVSLDTLDALEYFKEIV